MNTDRVRAAVVGLLGVLAIGATAATIDGSRSRSTSGSGGATGAGRGSGDGSTAGQGSGDTIQAAGTESSHELLVPVTELFGLVLAAGAVFLLAYAAYRYWRDGLAGLLDLARIARDVVIPLAFVGLLAGLVLWKFYQEFAPAGGAQPEQIEPGSAGQSAAEATSQSGGLDPAVVLAIVGGLVLLGVAVLVAVNRLNRHDTDGGGEPTDDEASDANEPATDPVAATPGLSPDDVDPSNAVYRAWRELATTVDREGVRTRTPAEVARRAVDAGLDRQAVQTITETFEEVRYGRRPATPAREASVRSALDRLDDTGGDGA